MASSVSPERWLSLPCRRRGGPCRPRRGSRTGCRSGDIHQDGLARPLPIPLQPDGLVTNIVDDQRTLGPRSGAVASLRSPPRSARAGIGTGGEASKVKTMRGVEALALAPSRTCRLKNSVRRRRGRRNHRQSDSPPAPALTVRTGYSRSAVRGEGRLVADVGFGWLVRASSGRGDSGDHAKTIGEVAGRWAGSELLVSIDCRVGAAVDDVTSGPAARGRDPPTYLERSAAELAAALAPPG